jgi:hypothetical protein
MAEGQKLKPVAVAERENPPVQKPLTKAGETHVCMIMISYVAASALNLGEHRDISSNGDLRRSSTRGTLGRARSALAVDERKMLFAGSSSALHRGLLVQLFS